jgi:hypothetical protein
MPGKDPHRPEGKLPDAERQQAQATSAGAPFQSPSAKQLHQRDVEEMRARSAPTRFPAEEAVGGSRPGVPSRVREAIERRGARDEE